MKGKKCIRCKKIFFVPLSQIRAGGGKFCSVKCRDTKIVVKCKYCGKKFYSQKCRIKYGWGKFCSQKCHYKKRFKDCHTKAKCSGCSKKIDIYKRDVEKIRFCSKYCRKRHFAFRKRKCKNCKKTILVKPFLLKSGGGKFCSIKCGGIYSEKESKKRLLKARRPCGQCGKLVQRYPSQFKVERGKFCSRACANKSKSERGRVKRICKKCEKEFTIEKNRALKMTRAHPCKYCSKRCAIEALKNHEMKPCAICDKPFKLIPYRAQRGGKYCSVFCENQARKGRQIQVKSMIYTPEVLKMLFNKEGGVCNFPSCKEPRAKNIKVPWSLCKLHLKKLRYSLYRKRQVRNDILRAEGLL